MAELELHLTCDHEVFGDGSGSVQHCMIRPAERMMELCERYGARISFYFDVCEYWAFKKVQNGQGFEEGNRPAERLEEHLKDIVKRGHDVQLHFHPQWLHAEYLGNDEWELDYSMWRLPEVEKHWKEGEEKPLEELFRRGKRTLEGLLQEVDPFYECHAFRAGAWSIQPEAPVLEAMENSGLKYESTVAPGVKLQEELTQFDFENAPRDLPYWNVHRSLCEVSEEGGLTEFPIFTVPVSGLQNARFTLLKLFKRVPLGPPDCKGKAVSKGDSFLSKGLKKLAGFFRSEVRMFNFTDGTTFQEMRFMTERATDRYQDREGVVPVVMIGHSKTFGNEGELEGFFRWVSGQGPVHLRGEGQKS